MAIVDFNALKKDKELFDKMADMSIKNIQAKKKLYDRYYNDVNRLKNEINIILIDIREILSSYNIRSNELSTLDFDDMVEFIEDKHSLVNGKDYEQLKIELYKIKLRRDEINKLRTKMIQIDIYDDQKKGLEDDTLDEEYIDMDKLRIERGITDKVIEEDVEEEITIVEEGDHYYYVSHGTVTLKMLASEIYGDESYWRLIYNNNDNKEVFKRIMEENDIYEIEEFVNEPSHLNGVRIILPRELEYYSDEFNTTTLKKVS